MRMSAAQVVLALALSPLLVETFTFPGDWHKIRQMMEARRDLQQLVGGLQLQLCRLASCV